MTKTTTKTTTELTSTELYAEYARTGPLEDLRFYLRAAERTLTTHELPARTVALMREMGALERTMRDKPTSKPFKRQVWALIDRYKGSIPRWYGNAGAPHSWIDDVSSEPFYWSARAELVRWIPEKGTTAKKLGYTSQRAEGPITAEQLVAYHEKIGAQAMKRRAFYEPTRRLEPLTPEQLAQLLAQPEPVKATPTAKPVQTTPATKTTPAPKTAAKPVKPVTIAQLHDPDALQVCNVCAIEQPLDAFTWGDGGRTIRKMCRSCRKQQQRETAARRKQAA